MSYALQVLSDTVAKGFAFYGDPKTTETQRFIKNFDIFFDCLNVRHPFEYIKRKKPNLKPYTSTDDERFTVRMLLICTFLLYNMQWLEDDFMSYLEEWENSVHSRQDVAEAEKAIMLLSWETIEGLRMTGLLAIAWYV